MYLEALDEKRKKVFDTLIGSSSVENFELGGGTALALQIGHRISFDFDFFTTSFLNKNLLKDLEKELSGNSFKILGNSIEELTFLIDGVKVTFLHYPFPRLLPCVNLNGVKAFAPLEIASTKAYTIGRRIEYKDYIDLYFLLKQKGISLRKILDLSEKKYGGSFNSRLFLSQLLLESDVKETTINFLNESVTKKEVFRFFEDLVLKFKLD